MTQFRRDVLKNITKPPDGAHAGLWLDKYLSDDGDDAKKDLVKQVTGKPISHDALERHIIQRYL